MQVSAAFIERYISLPLKYSLQYTTKEAKTEQQTDLN